jgi:uncharacterized protein (DUF1501 family)
VLVSVFLEGGIDSLSLLAPVGDPNYRRLRPGLSLNESEGRAFAEDERLRWHPAAAALADLHGQGKVTVLPSVGYTDPDQSHFTSRHFYEVGSTSASASTGWLGRYLDREGTSSNPLQGLALDGRLAPALATKTVPVAAVEGPDDYNFWARGVWGDPEEWMLDAMTRIGEAQTGDPTRVAAGQVAVQAGRLRAQLAPFSQGSPPAGANYPSSEDEPFPRQLASLSAMLDAGLPLRCVALTAPGDYDTHDDQESDFGANLRLTADSLGAFQRDLEARGLANRVLVHVWSEFGRRAEENGSRGTDHGAGGTGLVIGSRVRGQMIGEFPGLGSGGLDGQGNLRATSDFRAVYCALLEQWMGTDAGPIIPSAASFTRPRVVA